MYSLQINNRFLHLDYDDENEENVDNKKTVNDAKKSESKKDTKKPKNTAAAVVPTNTATDRSKDPILKSNQGKPLANTQPTQERVSNANAADDKRNQPQFQPPRQNTFNSGFGRGGAAAAAGNNGQFAANRQARPATGGGGFGDSRGAKREFERKSGSEKTGVRATDKREGSGPHNWGNSIKDFTTETFAPPADVNEGDATDEKKEEKSDEMKDIGKDGGAAEEQEPVQVVMSLEDYMKKLENEKVKPAFQIRKPGEGEGSFKPGKLGKKIQKNKDGKEEMVRIVEERSSGRVKKYLQVNFPSMAANRGGGGRGRGGRGGRGGQNNYLSGGGPGGRGDYGGQNNQPIVLDEISFPALSS